MKVLIALACVIAATSALPLSFWMMENQATESEGNWSHKDLRDQCSRDKISLWINMRMTSTLLLTLHMELLQSDVSRSKCTVDPAKEKVMTYSHHGAIITPSLLTLPSMDIINAP